MYDLIIIGGGPAGYNAAERAAHKGLSVMIAEKRAFGGVCLNEGCIPTKTLLYSAKIFDYAKHGKDYGIKFDSASADQNFIIDRKNKIVKTLVTGIKSSLAAAKAEIIEGEALIKGKNKDGFVVSVKDNDYECKNILICTGSEAAVPPIPGLRENIAAGFCMTNREILDLREIPKEFVVIGGGVIGLEMASYFNSMGSKVTVIEMLDKIGGPIDGEISALLLKNYQKKGIEFKLGAKVTAVNADSVDYELKGEKLNIKADKVLVSIGRRPTSANIGLENIGVLTDRGAILTDDRCMTNVAGVYAAGDVNGKSMLAHTAYREGEVAVNNISGFKDKINYSTIPAVIYTNPEVGCIGETSESVKQKGLDAEIKTISLRYSGRYLAENEKGDGIVKIIIDKKSKTLLGLHMIGNYASEIIVNAAFIMESKYTVHDVEQVVFPHPTVGEVIREGYFTF